MIYSSVTCPYRVLFSQVSWQTAEELSEHDRTGELNWAIKRGNAGPLIELAHAFTVTVVLQRTWADRTTCTAQRTHLTLNSVCTWNLETSNRPHHWSSTSNIRLTFTKSEKSSLAKTRQRWEKCFNGSNEIGCKYVNVFTMRLIVCSF